MLAHDVAFDILVYELCETRLLEFGGDELVSFEITQVASGLMVVALGEDGSMEEILWGDVDTTFVCEDMIVILPVQEMRPGGSRDVLQG